MNWRSITCGLLLLVSYCGSAVAQFNFFECAKNPAACRSSPTPSGSPGGDKNDRVAEPSNADKDRQLAEKESERLRQEEAEQRLSAQTKERESVLAAQVEAERKRRLELEARLAEEARLAADKREQERQLAEQRLRADERRAAQAKAEQERIEAAMVLERRMRQELEERLATVQTQIASRPPAQTATIRNAHAIVIGNAAYPGSARLDNPVNDANAVSQRLRSMGFTVTVVTDANRQRLVQAMTQFRRSAAAADLSVLFYSGHGVQIFGKNYILPTDVDQGDPAQATIQGLALNDVIETFLPGKTKLVFLDACRDNPLHRSGDRSVTKGLAPISVSQGTLISYATKDGQTASDGTGQRNSPFTQALLEHIGDPQDIGVVLRKVREKVMQATGGKQQPWEYGSLTGGELVLSSIRTPSQKTSPVQLP